MKKWISGLVLIGFFSNLMAQTSSVDQTESSPTGYVLIGLALIVLIVIILIRRQKRKFNN